VQNCLWSTALWQEYSINQCALYICVHTCISMCTISGPEFNNILVRVPIIDRRLVCHVINLATGGTIANLEKCMTPGAHMCTAFLAGHRFYCLCAHNQAPTLPSLPDCDHRYHTNTPFQQKEKSSTPLTLPQLSTEEASCGQTWPSASAVSVGFMSGAHPAHQEPIPHT